MTSNQPPKEPESPSAEEVWDIEDRGFVAPQYGLHGKGTGNKGPRTSVYVVDASPIMAIRRCRSNEIEKAKEDAFYKSPMNPFEVLDFLCKPKRNTMLLTHTVLKELLHNDGVCFGLADHDEKLSLSVSPTASRYPAQRQFAKWMRDHQSDIRLYRSVDDMLSAGEFDVAKGGIVIVDDKAFEDPPLNELGLYPAPPRNAGEKSILTMADMIANRYHSIGGKGYCVIGDDKDLMAPINNLGLEHLGQRTPKVFPLAVVMAALSRNGLWNPEKDTAMQRMLADQNKVLSKSVSDQLGNRVSSLSQYFTLSPEEQRSASDRER